MPYPVGRGLDLNEDIVPLQGVCTALSEGVSEQVNNITGLFGGLPRGWPFLRRIYADETQQRGSCRGVRRRYDLVRPFVEFVEAPLGLITPHFRSVMNFIGYGYKKDKELVELSSDLNTPDTTMIY
jgi:hypothetical protein